MATDVKALTSALEKLSAKLAPLAQFVDQWTLREQRPGLYQKFPVALPFRPARPNNSIIIAIGLADAFVSVSEPGLYDVTADNDCFLALNAQARTDGGYLLRGGLVYGALRISSQDTVHIIGAAAGGNVYLTLTE